MPKKNIQKNAPPGIVPPPPQPLSEEPNTESSSSPAATVVVGRRKSPTGWSRWRWWIIGGSGALLLGAAVFVGWVIFQGPTSTDHSNSAPLSNNNAAAVSLVPRQIDGVLVAPDKANTRIYAVMVENLIQARPQSGLDKASLVFETLAEGGITRFMALFPVGVEVKEIGPVRSARPYYVHWAEEFDALYVHAGGSPQALDYLRSSHPHTVDFNQFYHGGNFIRDDSRAAPHNLYTSTTKLYLGIQQVAPDLKPNFASWSYKDEPSIDARPTDTKDLVIDFSSFNYKVTYKYDSVQNQYQRFIGDKPHVTRDGNTIYTKNVVIEFAKITLYPNEKERLDIQTEGTGKMLLVRDGQVITGTWKKDSPAGRTQWLDDQGQTLSLDRGTTWVEVLPEGRTITY